jgi:indolepyruvate ferredoxin oxidoreductase
MKSGAPYLALGRKDAKTGRPMKVALPGWLVFPLFRAMAGAKFLRGTWLDPFGYAAERKMERALIREYRALIRDVAARVTTETLQVTAEVAAAPELIAGYGPVKQEGVAKFRARVAELLGELDQTKGVTATRETLPAPA